MKYKLAILLLLCSVNAFATEEKIFAQSECMAAYEYHFLNRAVANEDMLGVVYLIEGGANIDGKGYNTYVEKCGGGMEYSSPLMVAVFTNNSEITEYLLKNGANPNIVEGEGYTPIHYSQQTGNAAITKLLEKYGAKFK